MNEIASKQIRLSFVQLKIIKWKIKDQRSVLIIFQFFPYFFNAYIVFLEEKQDPGKLKQTFESFWKNILYSFAHLQKC